MAFDAQTAWMELGAFVASKPNHGQRDLLAEMARIAARHTIPDEDFKRALRLSLPAFADLLFDRVEQEQAPQDPERDVPDESDCSVHSSIAVRPSIAA